MEGRQKIEPLNKALQQSAVRDAAEVHGGMAESLKQERKITMAHESHPASLVLLIRLDRAPSVSTFSPVHEKEMSAQVNGRPTFLLKHPAQKEANPCSQNLLLSRLRV